MSLILFVPRDNGKDRKNVFILYLEGTERIFESSWEFLELLRNGKTEEF